MSIWLQDLIGLGKTASRFPPANKLRRKEEWQTRAGASSFHIGGQRSPASNRDLAGPRFASHAQAPGMGQQAKTRRPKAVCSAIEMHIRLGYSGLFSPRRRPGRLRSSWYEATPQPVTQIHQLSCFRIGNNAWLGPLEGSPRSV